MTEKAIGLTVAGILLLLGGIVFLVGAFGGDSPNNEVKVPMMRTYESSGHGVAFEYPSKYFLEAREVGNGERSHFAITLTEDTEENRAVREGRAPGREGPVAITFDIYQNNLDNLTLEDWLKTRNESNFKLSDGTYQKTTIAGVDAVRYRWSGLYEADNIALLTDKGILSVAVTYLEPGDQIRRDFEDIIKTLRIRK